MATEDARNFNWLLNSFVEETAGVHDAVAVSSDGVLMARSSTLDHAAGEQLCAIIAGCTSLARAADQAVDGAGFERVIIAMREGFLFVSAIADGSCLGVVASRDCDVGSCSGSTTTSGTTRSDGPVVVSHPNPSLAPLPRYTAAP